MHDVMAIALGAMQDDAARLERIGSNLANALTPGYKREVHVALGGASASRGADFAALVDGAGAGTASAALPQRDMRPGTLQRTGQPLDLALAGRGFFEVATPAGPAWTRHGQFRLDPQGRVVDAEGRALQSTAGDLVLANGTPTVDANGDVHEEGRVVARLRLVDVAEPSRLERAGGGLYAAGSRSVEARPLDEPEATVRQGWLENANVEPMREMVELVRTMRRFESVHRAVQAYDEMLGTGIRKLGDV